MHHKEDFDLFGKNLYSNLPVYIIPVTDKTNYYNMCQTLKDTLKDIDLTNKIFFDDEKQTIFIYYYPRIFKALIPYQKIPDCFHKFLGVESGGIHFNPYQIFTNYLNPQYLQENKTNFKKAAELFDGFVETTKPPIIYPQTDFNAHLYNAIPPSLFGNFNSEYIGIGGCHDEHSPINVIQDNLVFLANKGLTTLYLEGVPFEAQGLIDDYLANPIEPMPKELERILIGTGNNAWQYVGIIKSIIKNKLNIRVVGLESYCTYLADDSHQYSIENRIKAFNYIAYRIMQYTKKEGMKMFLVGADHLKESREILGISVLLNCTNLIIHDEKYNDGNDICVLPGFVFRNKNKYFFLKEWLKKNFIIESYDSLIASDFVLIMSPNSNKNLDNNEIEQKDIIYVSNNFKVTMENNLKEINKSNSSLQDTIISASIVKGAEPIKKDVNVKESHEPQYKNLSTQVPNLQAAPTFKLNEQAKNANEKISFTAVKSSLPIPTSFEYIKKCLVESEPFKNLVKHMAGSIKWRQINNYLTQIKSATTKEMLIAAVQDDPKNVTIKVVATALPGDPIMKGIAPQDLVEKEYKYEKSMRENTGKNWYGSFFFQRGRSQTEQYALELEDAMNKLFAKAIGKEFVFKLSLTEAFGLGGRKSV